MDVEITVNQEQTGLVLIMDKLDMLQGLLGMGFSIALVVVVIVAAVKLGWRFWPWVLGAGFLAWLML